MDKNLYKMLNLIVLLLRNILLNQCFLAYNQVHIKEDCSKLRETFMSIDKRYKMLTEAIEKIEPEIEGDFKKNDNTI